MHLTATAQCRPLMKRLAHRPHLRMRAITSASISLPNQFPRAPWTQLSSVTLRNRIGWTHGKAEPSFKFLRAHHVQLQAGRIYAHPRGDLDKKLVQALRHSKPTRGRCISARSTPRHYRTSRQERLCELALRAEASLSACSNATTDLARLATRLGSTQSREAVISDAA